jgi:capsular polysaccharide transport system permease protein
MKSGTRAAKSSAKPLSTRDSRIERLGGRRSQTRKAEVEADEIEGGEDRGPAVPSTVSNAKLRARHYGVIFSFLLLVLLPISLTCWYLWTTAVDQYESKIGFAVRAEGQASAPSIFGDLLGGGASGSTSEDMHILNAYILSQEIVQILDEKLDLRGKFSSHPEDPVYAFQAPGTIEDLVSYWQRMVKVNYNAATGLLELTVYAFTPEDATAISAAVLEESDKVINNLSAIARDDSTRFARENLESASLRATEARAALADFRVRNQVADPSAEVASQMGVLSSLQQQLATALVDLDLIRATGQENDPRILQLERRIATIEGRIEQERANMGVGVNGASFAEVLSEYEKLSVDKTFAEQAYLSSRAAFDGAMAAAAQQSRYLAKYVSPTTAEASTAPDRPLVALVAGIIAFLIWASMVLIYYALRDRR